MLLQLLAVSTVLLLLSTCGPAGAVKCYRMKSDPSDPGECDAIQNPKAGNPPLACSVSPLQAGGTMIYTGDNRFTATDFKQQCLVNAGRSCASSANTFDAKDPKLSCCSCYLYAQFGAGTNGISLPPNGKFVLDKPVSKHSLVMPNKACTGVENWNTNDGQYSFCEGEDIWDTAQDVLDDMAVTARLSVYGMAINPVSRRGQHQMHIHLARLYPSLASTIAYAHHVVKLTHFFLDCGLPNAKRLSDCSIFTGPVPTVNNPEVFIKAATKPSAAKPFESTFGPSAAHPKLDNSNNDLLGTSLMVVKVPRLGADATATHFALVMNTVGPAECFFDPQGEDGLTKACQ